jgi:hypothetical protein
MLVSVAVQPWGAELTMRSQAKDLHLVRPFVIEGGNQRTVDKYTGVRAAGTGSKFPRRPQSDVLSESITLFFIARNRVGFWIAREAKRRTGEFFCSRNRPCVSLRKTVAQADARPCFSPSD